MRNLMEEINDTIQRLGKFNIIKLHSIKPH